MSTWTVILLFGICLTTSVKGTPSYIIEVSEVNSTFNEVVDFTRRAIQSEFPDELLHIVITDIDECESSLLSKCSSFATCKNTEGSHVCECLPGYSDVDLNIPGQNCNDNDECKNGSHNCHRFAVCENTPGNYSCKCNSGYSGDGFVCIALDDISTGSPASTMSSSESTPRAKTTTMILSEATSSLDTLITTNLQSTEITTMLETMLPTEFTSSTQSVMDMISSETTKQRETVSLPTITKSRPTSLETSLSLVSTTSQLTTPSSGLTTIALNRTESTTNPTTPMFSTNGTLPEESVPAISSTRSQSTIVIEPTSNTIATSTSIATLPTTGTFNPTTPALSTYETMTTVKATPTISSTQFQSINTVESTSNMIGTSAPVITNTQGVTTIPTGIFKPPILTPENIALQARMFVLSINNLLQSGHLVAADAGAIGSSLSSFLNSGVTISTEVAGLLVDVQNSFFTAVGTFSKPPNPADASKLTNITIQLTEEMKLDFGNYEKNSSTVSIKAQDSTIEELQETGEPLVYVNDGGEIMLPIDFIQSAAQVTANKTDRFAFNQFVDSRMHIDPQVSSIIAKQAANGNLSLQADTTFVNSPIVSASIAGKPIIDSQSFAEIRLKKLATPPAPIPADNSTSVVTRYRNPRCVWWDYSLNNGSGEWSDRGCQFLENGPEFISCRCNHLTSFAVIMTVEVTVDDQILTILTYVGCALSIAGLLFTILTYSIFKVLRKHKSKRILLHFCTALCCVYISYLLGIATNIPNTQAQCIASGFFLHYFTLTVMAWMCVEVVDMYLLFVKIWTSFRKYVLKASLLAWGVPFILSIITLGVHFALEGRDTYQGGRRVYPLYEDGTICWLASDGLLYAFVIPSCILLTINLILFVIVLYHITCKRKLRRVRSTTRPIKARQHVINATALLLLAGPTWIIGYFINIEPIADGVFRRGLSYVFVFLNAFQGLWIFLIFSIRPVIVRRLWSELIFKGKFLDTSQTSSRSWSQGTRRNTVSTIAGKSQAVASNVVFEVRSGSTTKSEEENEDNSFSNANA